MEIAEIGVDNRHVGHAVQANALVGFVPLSSVEPRAIDDNVIRAMVKDEPSRESATPAGRLISSPMKR